MRLKFYNKLGATFLAGVVLANSGNARAAEENTGNNFGSIAENITSSIADLPGLLSALAYLFGVLLGVLGIMKIKDHVENPTQTQLKDGAIRLAAGGALFALPIIYEAMSSTIGTASTDTTSATLQAVDFGVE